jgi:hypothetical protein
VRNQEKSGRGMEPRGKLKGVVGENGKWLTQLFKPERARTAHTPCPGGINFCNRHRLWYNYYSQMSKLWPRKPSSLGKFGPRVYVAEEVLIQGHSLPCPSIVSAPGLSLRSPAGWSCWPARTTSTSRDSPCPSPSRILRETCRWTTQTLTSPSRPNPQGRQPPTGAGVVAPPSVAQVGQGQPSPRRSLPPRTATHLPFASTLPCAVRFPLLPGVTRQGSPARRCPEVALRLRTCTVARCSRGAITKTRLECRAGEQGESTLLASRADNETNTL